MRLAARASLLLFVLSGCVTARICDPVSADRLGVSDAASFADPRGGASRGSACTADYSPTQFERDYWNGYRRELALRCTPEVAARQGFETGRREDFAQTGRTGFGTCAALSADVAALDRAWAEGFRQAVCQEQAVARRAEERGSALGSKDDRWLEWCPLDARQALWALYLEHFQEAVSTACAPAAMAQLGGAYAKKERALDDALALAARCPRQAQAEAVRTLRESYDAELGRLALAREEARRAEEAQAQEREREERRQRQAQRDALARERLVESNRVRFRVKDLEASVVCRVDGGRAVLQLDNVNRSFLAFAAHYQLVAFDAAGAPVWSGREYAYLSASAGSSDRTAATSVPARAVGCRVLDVEVR